MTKKHRRAGWLVAGMMAVGLMLAPGVGEAGPYRWYEPPGPPMAGDPDMPNGAPVRNGRGSARVEAGPSKQSAGGIRRMSLLQFFQHIRMNVRIARR